MSNSSNAAPKPNTLAPTAPAFDKKAYQREYTAKRRAAKKVKAKSK